MHIEAKQGTQTGGAPLLPSSLAQVPHSPTPLRVQATKGSGNIALKTAAFSGPPRGGATLLLSHTEPGTTQAGLPSIGYDYGHAFSEVCLRNPDTGNQQP